MKTNALPIPNQLMAKSVIASTFANAQLIISILGIILLSLMTTSVHAQIFTWANKTTNSYSQTGLSVDNSGNSYVIANFSGTITLGGYTLTSHGRQDVAIIKYNSIGAVQWARRIGSVNDEQSGDIAVARYGDYVYIVGSFQSTVYFGSYHGYDVSPLTSSGSSDIFIARYIASTGTLDWAKRAGGTGDDSGYGISIDPYNNPYITGAFNGTAYFTSGGWFPYMLTSSGGSSDIFVAKFNTSGNAEYVNKLGSTGYDYGAAIVADYDGVYITGGLSPASNPYIVDVVVAKYNTSLAFQWSRIAGTGSTIDSGKDIFINNYGDEIYVTGQFGSNITFGSTTLTSAGSSDVFVVKYGKTGNVLLAKRYGGSNWDEGQSITEKHGEIYVAGTFNGTATFGHTTLNATGGAADRDIFVTRLFSTGDVSWARKIGSTGYDYGRGQLANYSYNTLFLTGHYGNTLTLGSTTLSGSGNLLTKITLPTLPQVSQLRIINASTDVDVRQLYNADVVNYTVLGTRQINIKAETYPATVGSVVFKLDGVTKIDNGSPYTYAGDGLVSGRRDYYSFTPSLGYHRLEVTAYSGSNGSGVKGHTYIYNFTIVDRPEVVSLTLINADTDRDIMTITSGSTINYTTIGTRNINIRANTMPATVGSVIFNLDGTLKTENAAPYAYAGDRLISGRRDYYSFTPINGYHRMQATPYTGSNGTGTTGTAMDIYFYIEGGSTARLSTMEEEIKEVDFQLKAYPNPFPDKAMLSFTPTERGFVKLEVYDMKGALIKSIYEGDVEEGREYVYEFNGEALPAGLYIGRLTTKDKVLHQKLVLNK